jgi:hypothetical protein
VTGAFLGSAHGEFDPDIFYDRDDWQKKLLDRETLAHILIAEHEVLVEDASAVDGGRDCCWLWLGSIRLRVSGRRLI